MCVVCSIPTPTPRHKRLCCWARFCGTRVNCMLCTSLTRTRVDVCADHYTYTTHVCSAQTRNASAGQKSSIYTPEHLYTDTHRHTQTQQPLYTSTTYAHEADGKPVCKVSGYIRAMHTNTHTHIYWPDSELLFSLYFVHSNHLSPSSALNTHHTTTHRTQLQPER